MLLQLFINVQALISVASAVSCSQYMDDVYMCMHACTTRMLLQKQDWSVPIHLGTTVTTFSQYKYKSVWFLGALWVHMYTLSAASYWNTLLHACGSKVLALATCTKPVDNLQQTCCHQAGASNANAWWWVKGNKPTAWLADLLSAGIELAEAAQPPARNKKAKIRDFFFNEN